MPIPVVILLLFMCYLAPYGVDARTGKINREKYLDKMRNISSSWKFKFLNNFILYRTFASTIQGFGIIIFASIYDKAKLVGFFIFIFGLLLGLLFISWPMWIKIDKR